MTDKQFVLRHYPDAYAEADAFGVVIYDAITEDQLGSGDDHAEAWADARNEIELNKN